MFIFFVRRSGAGHYYNKFPFRFVHGKVRNQFFDCSPACLLETFREFARKGSPPFFSEEFSQLRQCFKQKRSVGSPDTTSAGTKAVAPGRHSTSAP